MGNHYNPMNVNHGSYLQNAKNRHVGDLKPIDVDDKGTAQYSYTDNIASLFGGMSIGGRGFVITEFEDDMGKADPTNPQSLIDGNAGKILACGEIIIDDGTDPVDD